MCRMRTRQLLEGQRVPDAGVAGLHAVEGEQGRAWKQGHVPPPQAHGAHRSSARFARLPLRRLTLRRLPLCRRPEPARLRGAVPLKAEAEVRARLLSWYGLSRCTNDIVVCRSIDFYDSAELRTAPQVNFENFMWQLAMRAPDGGSQPQGRPAPGEVCQRQL